MSLGNLSHTQLAILRMHEVEPQPFIAKASLSTRVMILRGLLTFDRRRTTTSLTRQGRMLLELLADAPAVIRQRQAEELV